MAQANWVIYYVNGQLLGKKYENIADFNTFFETLDPETIIYYNGVEYIDRLPEDMHEVYRAFYKSMVRQWGNSFQVHRDSHPVSVTNEASAEFDSQLIPVEDVKPVKKPRKPRKKKEAQ